MGYSSGWLRRHTITIDYTKVSSGTQNNFPVPLIDGNLASDLYTNAASDGRDIRFSSDADGNNPLAFELVSYNPAGSAEIWVKIGTLSNSVNTTFYAWYDNGTAVAVPGTSTYGAENVWDAHFRAVHHMTGGTYTDLLDSTSANNDMDTQDGTPLYNQTGKLGKAVNFAGTSDVYKTSYNSPSGNATFSAWVKFANNTSTQAFVSIGRGAGGASLYGNGSASLNWSINTTYGPDAGVNSTNWQLVHGVYDGTARVYVDGVSKATAGGGSLTANTGCDFIIGALTANSLFCSGLVDEVRISDSARSAGWIATEYNSQNSPSTFSTATGATTITQADFYYTRPLSLLGIGN